jgi:hypothetical protein
MINGLGLYRMGLMKLQVIKKILMRIRKCLKRKNVVKITFQ